MARMAPWWREAGVSGIDNALLRPRRQERSDSQDGDTSGLADLADFAEAADAAVGRHSAHSRELTMPACSGRPSATPSYTPMLRYYAGGASSSS